MKGKSGDEWRKAAVILFVLYLFLLSYLLFFSEDYGRTAEQGYRYNLQLFTEIRRFWRYRKELGTQTVIINLAGNVAAFFPFGFFLPLLARKKGKKTMPWFVVLVCSAAFSLLVESAQLLCRVGAFDVDDIFLNSAGGLFGCLCVKAVLLIKERAAQTKQKRQDVNRDRKE